MNKRKFSFADFLLLTFLGCGALICLFPFYQTIVLSLASPADIAAGKVLIIPKSFDISAYTYLLKEGKVARGIGVSITITILGTLLSLIVTTAGAYALTKKSMPGRNFILNAIIVTMFFSGGLVPYFLTIRALGLMNNIMVMIVPVAINTFNLILMKNFLAAVPAELEESAKIDGANELVILVRIIVPVSTPIMATISLFYAVDRWNEWWNAMMFINNTRLYPLQLVLRNAIINVTALLGDATTKGFIEKTKVFFPESAKAAIIIISAVPILLVYPFIQKYFATGIMIGSIKG
ncbi:putative ABC transporter permease protein YtcP [Spirochaetia bacterium]|nr:putative ABC transporter permease protein YtcP [Spirochaetia bacterium]